MDIIFYAGSLRPGGGLTVAKIMIEAIAENSANNITVYTGESDSSQALKSIFEEHDNVHEKKFFPNSNSEIRYAISKLYFLPKSLLNRNMLVISVNYYIPVFCKLFVYHLNLLSFMRQDGDKFPKKIKEFDAALACRFATLNVFESDYLKETAEQYTGINIRNAQRLYIGVDSDFFVNDARGYIGKANILLVSSPQPHKDNHVCIDALKELCEKHNTVDWMITIVGGQSVEQWSVLQAYASDLGLVDKVKFLGPISKKSLSCHLNQSLCLVSASRVESFCMVALEAMASECPTIVTNKTSMPESVGDAALIVDSGSADQFSRAILSIYQDKNIRSNLINKGKERADKFTFESFKNNLIILINMAGLQSGE